MVFRIRGQLVGGLTTANRPTKGEPQRTHRGLQIRDGAGNILLEGGRLDQPPTQELCAALAAGRPI